MEKFVCTQELIPFCKLGMIYTLKDNVRYDGVIKLYQFEEKPDYSWVSDDILKSHFKPAKDIKASVVLTYGDGHEDIRYFVSNESAEEFYKKAIKNVKLHNRKNAKSRPAERKLVESKINYNVNWMMIC
ncbi:MAG: hypothetical protein UIM53_02805 [Acutalibacteraceae bacterium]|nr:hypothetical protein [Acutalibacteraceae bacterium]